MRSVGLCEQLGSLKVPRSIISMRLDHTVHKDEHGEVSAGTGKHYEKDPRIAEKREALQNLADEIGGSSARPGGAVKTAPLLFFICKAGGSMAQVTCSCAYVYWLCKLPSLRIDEYRIQFRRARWSRHDVGILLPAESSLAVRFARRFEHYRPPPATYSCLRRKTTV